MLNSVRYCLRQAAASLTRNFWLAVAAAGIVAVTLLILGAFVLFVGNLSSWTRTVESSIEINAFLEEGADHEKVREAVERLPGVASVTFISKEQALREVRKSLGDRADILEGLDENPLPDTYRIKAARAEDVPSLARSIERIAGVDKVNYGQGIVEKVIAVTRWINLASLTSAGLLGIAAVFLIMTTIRLSVAARQEEIGIMKILGASDWFVRSPFLMEGMTVGFGGAVLATLILSLVYLSLVNQLEKAPLFFLQPVTDREFLLGILGGVICLGLFIGGLGSLISVRKFLRV
ncbi:MAG: Cell division protein FtsX [Clostridia bacterium 62_21]|nr:MAG: Cell division protein FtsX [Clostridia bacterium 62_21]